jgi:hypothetical protein
VFYNFEIAPNGNHIYALAGDSDVYVVNTMTRTTQKLSFSKVYIMKLAVSPNSNIIVLAGKVISDSSSNDTNSGSSSDPGGALL